MAQLSVIIPTLNVAHCIGPALEAVDLSPLVLERLVVDGGSTDETTNIAEAAGAKILRAPKGRGEQLAAGAAAANGAWLLFLHADTVLEPGWSEEVDNFIADAGPYRAAVFRFALDDRQKGAARVEAMVAWRSRALALPYGDQGLLISRHLYDEVGGFNAMPLFEDVDMIRRIGRDRLTLLETRAVTSAERYRRGGYFLRPARNLFCLFLYFAGVPPRVIARLYG